MVIYNMETAVRTARGHGGVRFVEINQKPMDTFAVVSLTKVRGGNGYCGITECNGEQLKDNPPAHFRRLVETITLGITCDGEYAQGMITLFRDQE